MDLGLLIIDEEHRFGVRQKEHIKKLRKVVDILTLTATPIPRTLNFTMTGVRDISLIATPPEQREAQRPPCVRLRDFRSADRRRYRDVGLVAGSAGDSRGNR